MIDKKGGKKLQWPYASMYQVLLLGLGTGHDQDGPSTKIANIALYYGVLDTLDNWTYGDIPEGFISLNHYGSYFDISTSHL